MLEAAQDFSKAVELDPQGKDPLTTRARVLAAAALETLQAARKDKAPPAKAPAAAPAKVPPAPPRAPAPAAARKK